MKVLLPIFYRTTHTQAISAATRRHDDDREPLQDNTIRYKTTPVDTAVRELKIRCPLVGTCRFAGSKATDKVSWDFFELAPDGSWVGIDGGNNVFYGSYFGKDKRARKLIASFDSASV